MKRKTKRSLAVILSALLVGSALIGCGGGDSSDSGSGLGSDTGTGGSSAKTAEDPDPGSSGGGGKRLVIGTGQTCGTLNPMEAYDGWYAVRFGFGQTLTKMNDDLTISGWLAEDDYSASEDNKTWTFTLKDGVTFSNGNACDAEAAKNAIEHICENATRSADYFKPTSIEADGQTLTITCEEAEPILPNKLADPLFTIIDTSADMSDLENKGPIGTGPFVVKSFDSTTKECVVEKNKDYWAGDANVDEIDFIYTEDQTTLTMGLQNGDFDAVYNISMTDIGMFEDNADHSISRTASGRTTHGFMNQNRLLKDETLRRAILQVIDREAICEHQLNGQYVAGKTLVTSAADYGYDELIDKNTYDPDNAAKILDDAGYEDKDGDGFRETPDGEKLDLEFLYYTGRPEQQVMVEATQAACQEIGIKITPSVQDTQTVVDRLSTGEYDMLCMSINVLNCADPENHMNTHFKSDGFNNAYGWSNKQFDSIMDTLHETADPGERTELVKEAEQILLDETVCIYFCYPIMNFVMKSNVSGITSTPADYYWVSEDTTVE